MKFVSGSEQKAEIYFLSSRENHYNLLETYINFIEKYNLIEIKGTWMINSGIIQFEGRVEKLRPLPRNQKTQNFIVSIKIDYIGT